MAPASSNLQHQLLIVDFMVKPSSLRFAEEFNVLAKLIVHCVISIQTDSVRPQTEEIRLKEDACTHYTMGEIDGQ